MESHGKFWWRVVTRYDDDQRWVDVLRLAFLRDNGGLKTKGGYPVNIRSYDLIREGLAKAGRRNGKTGRLLSRERAKQLANEALACATFAFYRSVIPTEMDRSVLIEKFIADITEGRRQKDKTRRVKKNGVHRRADERHVWLPSRFVDSDGVADPMNEWPGKCHTFIIDCLSRC